MTDTALDRLCASVPDKHVRAFDRLFLDRIPRWRALLWTARGLARIRPVRRPAPGRLLPRYALFVAPTNAARRRAAGAGRPA